MKEHSRRSSFLRIIQKEFTSCRSPYWKRSKLGIWDYEPNDSVHETHEATLAMPGTRKKLDELARRVQEGLPSGTRRTATIANLENSISSLLKKCFDSEGTRFDSTARRGITGISGRYGEISQRSSRTNVVSVADLTFSGGLLARQQPLEITLTHRATCVVHKLPHLRLRRLWSTTNPAVDAAFHCRHLLHRLYHRAVQ